MQHLWDSLADVLRRMHHGLALRRSQLVQPLHTESADDEEIGNNPARGDITQADDTSRKLLRGASVKEMGRGGRTGHRGY